MKPSFLPFVPAPLRSDGDLARPLHHDRQEGADLRRHSGSHLLAGRHRLHQPQEDERRQERHVRCRQNHVEGPGNPGQTVEYRVNGEVYLWYFFCINDYRFIYYRYYGKLTIYLFIYLVINLGPYNYQDHGQNCGDSPLKNGNF